jgi:hypothetical protein
MSTIPKTTKRAATVSARAQAAGAVAVAEDAKLAEPVKRKCGCPKKVAQPEVPAVHVHVE